MLGEVLRVDIHGRETPEETREIAEKAFAERERRGAKALLMVIRGSRAIFKVEEYGLSQILQRIAAIPGLRVAAVAESPDPDAMARAIAAVYPGAR